MYLFYTKHILVLVVYSVKSSREMLSVKYEKLNVFKILDFK